MAKVSIVIPCYNDGRYLEESISSARAQTYPDVEIIVVDDGSDEPNTQEIVGRLEKDPGLRVVHGRHEGPAAARNLGIRHAGGEFILPLDADDRIEPTYAERAIPILQEDPRVGIVYSRADYFGAKTTAWDIEPFSMERMLLKNVIFNAAFFRRADWEKTGGYHEAFRGLEDWDFWLTLLELGLAPVRIDEVLFHYRSRPDSFSRKHVPHQWLMKMYRDILLRHLPLYRKEIVAYNDGVREEISCMGHVREQLESLLQEAQEARFVLSEDNRWMRLSRQIPWAKLEERFGHCFSRWKGRFAAPARVALGLYLIQAETGLSDVMLLRELPENPYMQYFCHLMGPEISLEEADMAYVHEQLTPRVLEEINGTLGE